MKNLSRIAQIPVISPMLALFIAFSLAQMPGDAAASQGEGPDIAHFSLANGLEVVVIPDRRAPVVTHMLWYKVGSADEQAGKSGIAHFFEHLMFKATRNHAQGDFSKAVAEIGGQENAFTSYDYTAYFQQVAPSALKTMMAFEADRMRNLVLTEDVVNTERNVVIEERSSRIDNDPDSLLSEEVSATMYQNHPYGRPVIGWMNEIEQLNLADAVAFYNRHYVPNNAILVVAGDVDADTVHAMAAETYGRVPRGAELAPRKRPEEPRQDTSRTVTLKDPRVTRPQFGKRWLVPSYANAATGEAEALDLLSEILGGGTRSRLYQELVVRRRIAASTGAWYQGTSLDTTTFGVWGSPLKGTTIEDMEQAVLDEVRLVAAGGVSEDELEKAKNRFLKSVIFARDNQSGMARIYGAGLASGETMQDIDEWPERVRAVTAEQVKAAAARYLDDDHSVTSYLLPEGDNRP